MQKACFLIMALLFLNVTETLFLISLIYCTHKNLLNSDTVWDKGIKPTVKMSKYYLFVF